MPFIQTTHDAPPHARPEDLFRSSEGSGECLLRATLRNGVLLSLSEGRSMNFPSPFPLYYEPYSIEIPEVIEWLDKVRSDLFEEATEDQVRHLTEQWGERGVGRFVPIKQLALGRTPYLDLSNLPSRSRKELIYNFRAPIRKFEPIDLRANFRRAPR